MAGGVIYVLLGVLVVAAVVWWLVARGGKRYGLNESDKHQVKETWANIEATLQEDNESAYARVIVEADKLLDFALKQRGVPGEAMGERLRNGKRFLKSIDGVWQAHKLRNQLAHDMGTKLNRNEVERALKWFKQGLKELGAF